MNFEEFFTGIILPLIVIPNEFLAYSIVRGEEAILIVELIVIVGEVITVFLGKRITKKKLRLQANRGLILVPIITVLMTFFPPLSSPSYLFLLPAGVVGGVCEEIVYRSYMISDNTSVFVQGVLWGFLHVFDGIYFFLWTILIGIVLGFIAKKYGILPTMIIHVISNVLRIIL